jgi:plastocyanin
MRTSALVLSFLVATLALAAGGGASTHGTVTLTGTVGPGFTITLKNRGKVVKTLAPTKFTFAIHDNSNIHNFHLTGPGVNRKTSVAGTGVKRWTLTLRKGTYRFVCDPHASSMKGSFIVAAP